MKRINWLDTTRGLAFLMVIYSHLDYCNQDIMRYFSPVFLTMFFFVSGYLFKENCSFSFVLEQRTRTILLPFLTLGGGMITLSNILTFNEKIPLEDEIKGWLFQNGQNEILWFVAALYVYSLAFYWIERWSGSADRLLAVCGVLFLLNAIYSYWLHGPSIPWHIHSTGFACFYMGLGKWYRHNEERVNEWGKKTWVGLAAIAYVALISIADYHVSFGGSKWVVDSLAVTMGGLFVMIFICKWWFDKSRFLLFVGANTLFYFAFHGKGYSLLQTITAKCLAHFQYTFSPIEQDAMGFVLVFTDALLLIVPAMIVNKYLPFILGRGFKLWKA